MAVSGKRTIPLVVVAGALVAGATAVVCEPIDGYGGWVLSLLADKEDTVYSAAYSDAAFKQLRVGMTEGEVAVLLGEPLDIYTAKLGAESLLGWQYSRSDAGASYRVRCVLFREGRVFEVLREFYLD